MCHNLVVNLSHWSASSTFMKLILFVVIFTTLHIQSYVGHKQDSVFMSSPNVSNQLTLVVKGQKSKFHLPHIQDIKAIFDIAVPEKAKLNCWCMLNALYK